MRASVSSWLRGEQGRHRYNPPAMPQPTEGNRPAYKRVLLKISGEGFCHEGGFGIEAEHLEDIARQCVDVAKSGIELAVVVGGGNFIRGATFAEDGHIKRATADYMGMLATVINALALQETMEKFGQPTRVQSAIAIHSVCESFIRRRAIRHLEKGRAVILAAGTGNPFFTTDTAAALRGAEIGAELVLKATKVDGVYTADPKTNPNATRYATLTFDEAIAQNLGIMDATAFALCRDQKLPIKVFSIFKHGALRRVVLGEDEGTLVHV